MYGCQLAPVSPEAIAGTATQIVDASGVEGGLVAVVGCDDPVLLAQLHDRGPYLVHGLDDDGRRVAAAQTYLQDNGVYGAVTVSRIEGDQLPFVDSLVNLLVVAGDTGIAEGEMTRVLAPGGAIADIRESGIITTTKDVPGELDEWTHYLYNASNNAVSQDTVVGPPKGLRWVCGPKYARSHEHLASLSAMVTANGRVFTIIDRGPVSSVFLPPQWQLVARDAFSGVLLWERPIGRWESHLRDFRSGPPEIGRRMVAAGDRVYVSLGYGDPVSVLDAATGKTDMVLAGTEGARELLLSGGVLYVLADDMSGIQHDARKQWIDSTAPTPRNYLYPSLPRIPFDMYGTQRIIAVGTDAGETLWESGFQHPGEIMPATMAVDEGRACVQTVSHVVCLDGGNGRELWRSERPVAASRFSWSTPTLVISNGVVLTVDRRAEDSADTFPPAKGSKWLMAHYGVNTNSRKQPGDMVAFSLADGSELWRAPCFENYTTPLDIFVIQDVVWVGALRHGNDPGFTEGRDLKTGRVVTTFAPQRVGGHHRCYRNKATERWLLVGRGGIEFLDVKNGTHHTHGWVRGTCQYGVMPANGLVYAPQHSCACYATGLLTGFNALSARSSDGKGSPQLEMGPVYDDGPNLTASTSKVEWPTYRHDAARSGYQDLPVPRRPAVAWTKGLIPPITAPVVVGDMVFVAETDRHVLHGVSGPDGQSVWRFAADGRIDSPPTVFGGLCLFGTRNGYVYCLRAIDGSLVWRFRAGSMDRRLFSYGQLESVWPVHGSVLVDRDPADGVPIVYFAAGRSSRLDGGIRLYALEASSGKTRHMAAISMDGGKARPGVIPKEVLPDVLSVQKDTIWMRHVGLDKNLASTGSQPHLYAPRGFLDDTWWHRTHWIYGQTMMSGYTAWPLAGNVAPTGRLLAFDGGKTVYGYGRNVYRAGNGHVRPDAVSDYTLFAQLLRPDPGADSAAWWSLYRRYDSEQKTVRQTGRGQAAETTYDAIRRDFKSPQIQWREQLPFVARAMVLARDGLLLAGGESLPGRSSGDAPGVLWVASREDRAKITGCALPAPPVLDGMALTARGVFVSAIDGSLTHLSDEK